MNNHAHFLFQVNDIEELSKFFHKLNTMYARYYNYMEGDRVGYVYRDRFVSEPITSYRYLIQCIKYIHFNPVKAKIVERCEEYKFSSYKLFKNKLDKREFNSILNKDAYEDICNNIDYNINFYDIEEDRKEKIIMGIMEFIEKNKYETIQIFQNRNILKEVILYLKKEKSLNYKEIGEFFDITRGSMQRIIKKV